MLKERLALLRKHLKKNQTQFAEGIGLTQNFWSLVETGTRSISDRTISDICRVYNVNEAWLRDGIGEMFEPVSREDQVGQIAAKVLESDGTDFRFQFVSNIYDIPDEGLEYIKDFVLKLADCFKKNDAPE